MQMVMGQDGFINSNDHTIYHTGTLDNFSSEILLNPKKSYGIVVLANMNSSHVTNLTDNLNSQILNNDHYTTIEQKLINQQILITQLQFFHVLAHLYF